MKTFHVYLYGPNQGAIDSSFEEAQRRLSELDSLYMEPDGSFVWSMPGGGEQVFGMLYDAGGKIQYCDLQGCCSLTPWVALCEAIAGGPREGLVVAVLPEMRLQDLQRFEGNALQKLQNDSS